MPQVPGLLPDVAPTTQGAPNVGLEVPVDAFGGAVGHALEGLGQDVTQASDRVWQQAVNIQNLHNETTAKEADARYMMESGKLHAAFTSKEGLNAGPQALEAHIKELQDLRVSLRKDLNPAAAKMYDASSLSFMGRNIFNAAGHSGQQMKVASNNAATSRKEIIKNGIEANPDDEVSFQRGNQAIKGENQRLAENGGWDKAQLDATNQHDISDYWSKRIVATANNRGALGAQQMLNTAIKNKSINPLDAEKVQATVDRKLDQQGSRAIADKVLGGYRAGEDKRTEQEFIDDGVNEVKNTKGLTDDQRQSLEDHTRLAISAGYRQQKSVQRDQQYQDYQTLTKALDTPNAEGRLPTTVDQLKLIDPEIGPALDRMRPTQVAGVGRKLLANAMGKSIIPTPENQDRYKTLLGMSDADHGDRDAFMAVPLYEENIPKFQRDQLLGIQNQLRKQAVGDPRVKRAMSYFDRTGVLANAGIDKKNAPEDYYNFVGALQDALSTRQQELKAPLKDEEIQKIGNQLLQEKGLSKGWLWDSKVPLFKTSVPEDDEKRIKADPYWAKTNQVPTTQQIHNYYVREQYNKLFKGSAGASKDAIVPGTVSAPVSE